MIITRKKKLQEQVQYKRICKSRILAPSDYCLHNQLIFFQFHCLLLIVEMFK